jgi:subtilase family serine protease
MKLKHLIVTSTTILTLLLAGNADAALADAHARVSYQNYSVCTKARVNRATCLAVRRKVMSNGIEQHANTADATGGFGANDLRKAYGVAALGTKNRVIAIVDAYHSGTAFDDLTEYRNTFGLPEMLDCTVTPPVKGNKAPCFYQQDQRGNPATSALTTNGGWAQEIALDVEMASAMCPKCSILLVEADTPTVDNLNEAVGTAADFAGVVTISNSYGGPDVEEPADSPYAAAAASGIAVVASSGDSGYGVSAPASYTSVIGVGGTNLQVDAKGKWTGETVWSMAGSGCSSLNATPTWQDPSVTNCDGKSTVDVAAVADPASGVKVYFDGFWYQFGGTSASAPIIAGLFAVKNNFGDSAGDFLAEHAASLHDVSAGGTGRCRPVIWCQATTGWDGASGLGSPNSTGAF